MIDREIKILQQSAQLIINKLYSPHIPIALNFINPRKKSKRHKQTGQKLNNEKKKTQFLTRAQDNCKNEAIPASASWQHPMGMWRSAQIIQLKLHMKAALWWTSHTPQEHDSWVPHICRTLSPHKGGFLWALALIKQNFASKENKNI